MKKIFGSRRNIFIMGAFSVFASAALVLAGCAGATGPAGPTGPAGAPGAGVSLDSVSAGQALYVTNCQSCHGADAAGGIVLGTTTSATGTTTNVTSTNIQLRGSRGFRYGYQPFLIERAIMDGKDQKDGDLASVMPRWRGKLTETQVYSIISYLFTVPLTPSTGQPMPTSFK